MIPPAVLLCVLAGAGFALLAKLPASNRLRLAATALAIVIALPFALQRAANLDEQTADRGDAQRLNGDLPASIAAAGGKDRLAGCRSLWVGGTPRHPGMDRPLAWHLDVPLHRVRLLQRKRLPAGAVLFAPRDSVPRGLEPLGSSERWVVARSAPVSCR
jgi:uncharacterized membrane protein YccC